jgi:hypothetical protein
MSINTQTARLANPAVAALALEREIEARIAREMAQIAGMMVASEETGPTDTARAAALTGLLGRWGARRAARRAEALH